LTYADGCKTAIATGITSITSVTLPNSVTSIESFAFCGCSRLTSITIPNSVTSIGGYAFYYCSGLTSIEIPSSVTSIGSEAFRDCSGLTSIEIPSSVTSIEGYAFYRCSGLTSIEIPSSVTSIGNYAFQGCSGLGLTSITIPSSVTSIGSEAFSNCKEVTLLSQYPPSIGNGAFSSATIYVPESAVGLYKAKDSMAAYTVLTIESRQPTCVTPVVTKSDEGWVIDCETEEVTFSLEEETKHFELSGDNGIVYNPVLYLYVYAQKEGYNRSEPAVLKCPIRSAVSADGDVNGDGEINISDVTTLVNKILGK